MSKDKQKEKMDKNKRHTSGSRSMKKSKKSKPNDISLDIKPHRNCQKDGGNHQPHTSKNKTENSLNKEREKEKEKDKDKDKDKDKSKGKKNINHPTFHTTASATGKYPTNKKNKLIKGLAIKGYTDQSKQLSRSVSAQRKHSLVKMNRTEANFENEDMERRIFGLKKILSKIHKPATINTKQIHNFYKQIEDTIQMVSQPLYTLLSSLHELYMSPIGQILQMISPYEALLQRKQQLSRAVEEQVKYNQEIYGQLSEEEIHIIKLKETIEEQRQLIEERRKYEAKNINRKQNQTSNKQIQMVRDGRNIKESNIGKFKQQKNEENALQRQKQKQKKKEQELFKNQGVLRNMKKDKQKYQIVVENHEFSIDKDKQRSKQKQIKSTLTFKEHCQSMKQQQAERDSSPIYQNGQLNSKTVSLGFAVKGGLKLDLGAMNKSETVGFHDQFYSKLDQFSQSWRNQALREKRF